MTAADILQKLKSQSTAKTSETLDAIYTICIEQQERGIHDFSLATIARLGQGRGVPKAQSLRNQTGEKYRALIKAFEDEKPRAKQERPKSDLAWVEELSNPKHRLLAKMLASELTEAKQKVQELIPPGTRIEVYDHKASVPDEESRLSKVERRALEYLLSKPFLDKWHFTKSEYGEVLDSQKEVVFKAGTIAALEKALKNL